MFWIVVFTLETSTEQSALCCVFDGMSHEFGQDSILRIWPFAYWKVILILIYYLLIFNCSYIALLTTNVNIRYDILELRNNSPQGSHFLPLKKFPDISWHSLTIIFPNIHHVELTFKKNVDRNYYFKHHQVNYNFLFSDIIFHNFSLIGPKFSDFLVKILNSRTWKTSLIFSCSFQRKWEPCTQVI